ncbi:hypothetical protein [Parvicella tangerina]|nr:hypothetical protein [Parvicella tangerina]
MKFLLFILPPIFFATIIQAQQGGIIFYTNPPSCEMSIDTMKVYPRKHYILDSGHYELKVSKEYYLTETFDIDIISDSSQVFRVSLEQDPMYIQYLDDLSNYKRKKFARIGLPILFSTGVSILYFIGNRKNYNALDELKFDVLGAKTAYETNVFSDEYDQLKADFDRLKGDYDKKVNYTNTFKIGGAVLIAGGVFFIVKGIIKSSKDERPSYNAELSRLSILPYYNFDLKNTGINIAVNF